MKIIIAIIALALLFAPGAAGATEIRGKAVFDQVNAVRTQNGRKALVPEARLVKAAQMKADDMAKEGYFAHRSPKGKWVLTWINAVKYPYRTAGENLAEKWPDTETLVTAWINSPTHKANILENGYTDTGIGIAQGKNGIIIVQMFGQKR